MPDKFSATWVSHSSLNDFLQCPRAYYLKNVYKDPKTNRKIQLVAPSLSLGSAVHEVLESLSQMSVEERFRIPMMERFHNAWQKVTGKKGGFFDASTEELYKRRGESMIRRVEASPGPLARLAVKIKDDLPYYWLSEEENIILCGKIDWLEYLPEEDSVHIVDFKTSKREEDEKSLQLPIYYLLTHNCQRRNVNKASYWYLDFNDDLTPQELPDLESANNTILKLARDIATARKLERFNCPQGTEGCWACSPFERILKGDAELVGEDEYRRNLYVISESFTKKNEEESVIL